MFPDWEVEAFRALESFETNRQSASSATIAGRRNKRTLH